MRRRFTCRVPSNSKSFALAAVLFFVVSLPFAHQAASAAERARECQIEEPAGGQGFQGFFGVGADERPPAGAFAPPASPPVEPAVPAVPPEDLPEPPTGEDLAASTREVREIFKLDELRSDKEKAQMISRLIKLAQNTPNHNGRYVLLFEAARLAVGIDDLQMAITALDALARSHRVDSLDLKVKAIGAMSFSGKDEIEAAKPVVAALLGQALAEDRYQVADALIDSIGSEARDRRDFTYVKQLIEVKEQVDALAEQHAQAKETIARLESGEKEPADAVTAGRYYIVAAAHSRRRQAYGCRQGHSRRSVRSERAQGTGGRVA